MRILITGGTGFIGYNLVPILQQEQHEIICLVRETSNLRWLNSIGHIEYRYGDLLAPESLDAALDGIECVIHMAGTVVAVHKRDFYRINHIGTRNVVEAAARKGSDLSRFIMVSSLSAAGPSKPDKPMTESMPDLPVSAYGESKLLGERAVQEHREQLRIAVVRPPIVYGPKDVGVQGFFQLVKKGWQIKFPGENPRFSMVYVKDLSRALVTLVTADYFSGSQYYISDPVTYSVPEIQDIIADVLNRNTTTIPIPKLLLYPAAAGSELVARLRNKPTFLNFDKLKEVVQPAWTCSPEKFAQDFGFHTEYGLAEGAAETVEWYQSHGWL